MNVTSGLGCVKSGHDCVRMLARIADDVRHSGPLPSVVDRRVAAGARLGTDVRRLTAGAWRGCAGATAGVAAGEEERADPHDQDRAEADHENDRENASNIAIPCSSSAASSLCICRSPSTSRPTAGASGRL